MEYGAKLSDELSSNDICESIMGDGYREISQTITHELASDFLEERDDSEFEVLVQAYLRDIKYYSKKEAIWNIVYSVINAGLVALPYAANSCGIFIYLVVITIVCVISRYTSSMVICMADEQNVRTLEDLGGRAFGIAGFYAISILQVLLSTCLMCVALAVWSDITSAVLHSRFELVGTFVHLASSKGTGVLGAILILPLCIFTKTMKTLRYSSFLTVFAMLAAICAVIGSFVMESTRHKNVAIRQNLFPRGAAVADILFIIPFCFSFNQKAFTIYSCLKRRNASRWKYCVTCSMIFVLVIYLTFGIFGSLSLNFESSSDENFIELNYFLTDNSDVFLDILRLVVSFCLLQTIPVDCLVACTTLRRLLRHYWKSQCHGEQMCSYMLGRFVGESAVYCMSMDSQSQQRRSWIQSSRLHHSVQDQNNWDADTAVRCLPCICSEGVYDRAASSDRRGSNHRGRPGSVSSGAVSFGSSWDFDYTKDDNDQSTDVNGDNKNTVAVVDYLPLPLESCCLPISGDKSIVQTVLSKSIGDDNDLNILATSVDSDSSDPGELIRLISGLETTVSFIFGDDDNKSIDLDDSAWRTLSRDDAPYSPRQKSQPTTRSSSQSNNDLSVDMSTLEREISDRKVIDHAISSHRSKRQVSAGGSYNSTSLHRQNDEPWSSCVSLSTYMQNSVAGISLLSICLVVCIFVEQRTLIVLSIGSFFSISLVFLVPSMVYFRVGLNLDYQVIPLCGIIPNRLYMFFILVLGTILLLGNATTVIYLTFFKISPQQ